LFDLAAADFTRLLIWGSLVDVVKRNTLKSCKSSPPNLLNAIRNGDRYETSADCFHAHFTLRTEKTISNPGLKYVRPALPGGGGG
jgi:hypothetical protein